ncbi:MAG TPA: 5-methyltetrahydropteroyltriglutamate--homocysteine S-methyltransferase [Thermomicrobiales bacterium]|nr:5-methyltetrahydropteroyltriglutamate--homocysteine S-methyltransferase [Thermomicrobiales bacterium]
MAQSTNLGYPRIGKNRELKRAVERYWSGKASGADVETTAREIRHSAFAVQNEAGIDLIPCNDFTLYDHILDTACLWGLVPERFNHQSGTPVSLDTYLAMARGNDDTLALEMTKWFDTNYHYLVPEFDGPAPSRTDNRPVEAYREAREQVGDKAKPVIVGPVTFVILGKHHTKSVADHVADLTPLYKELLSDLANAGARWVQVDEPCLVTDLTPDMRELYESVYASLASGNRPNIMLQTYFGSLRDNWDTVMGLPVEGIGLDLVRTPNNLNDLLAGRFPRGKVLSAGIVNGRGVWKTDLSRASEILARVADQVGAENLWVGPSCSLLTLPHDVRLETTQNPELLANLAFAEQRLSEIKTLTRAINSGPDSIADELAADHERIKSHATSSAIHAPTQERVASLDEGAFQRSKPFADRIAIQNDELGLPAYPTTTIGSFPQASDVRSMRARVRSGKISPEEYEQYVHNKIDEVLAQQEDIGLDVLVHGEFERTDMVEFFAEQMAGFLKTEHGWVQSYGSRCVRPPIIVGDVHRPHPMTVDTIAYAQSRSDKPVKGMLTGPVTILNWSFAREDIPRSSIAYQIALALRDEVSDLEAANIKIVQIDEPALREGLPLVRDEWQDYLDWAIKAFRLSASGAAPGTQIHTHMCYSEFNDIIAAINDMDADVISIENSRSNEELLQAFTDFSYERMIGPGVYDVHSARVPEADEMAERLQNAARVLGAEHLWVNPDCGLKTRGDAEVWPSLRNMVEAARQLRQKTSAG